MFANHHRLDFTDTRSVSTLPGFSRFDTVEAAEQMAQTTDAADRMLLRLVFCTALGTMLLALASSIGF